MSNQNDIERLKDKIKLGQMTADEANVEMVRIERVNLILNSIPRDVRNALNKAVKAGYLSHKKKNGLRPEVYYHPDFEYLANEKINNHAESLIEALKKVCI
jgi:cell wall assembly regulator SMI1